MDSSEYTIHNIKLSARRAFVCSKANLRHIVWCLSCPLKWTTVTTLHIFKVWGSAAFRPMRTDRWSGCSLSSVSAPVGPHPTHPWLPYTSEPPQRGWLLGVDYMGSSRVVKRLWQTISGGFFCVWSFHMWSLSIWKEVLRQSAWACLHPLASDDLWHQWK